MKLLKRISIALVFVIIGTLSLGAVSYMVRPVDGSNEEIRNRITGFYAEPDDSLDMVVLGSSAVYRYINNPLLWKEKGLTSYNFATPGLNIFMLEYLIDEIQKTQDPELYVIDARKFILTEDNDYKKNRFQQIVNNLKYSKTRIEMINRLIENPMERFYYYFDLMIYHDNWEKLTRDSLEYADNERENPTKGWDVVKSAKELEPVDVSSVTEKEPLSAVAEETLVQLLKKCKEEGINVLFLATPWQIGNTNQKQSNYMKEIVEEYGFDYLDMNLITAEIGIDFSVDFYNDRHVNAVGAEKVTKYFGEYLEENYDFQKNHTEETISSWDAVWEKLSEY